MHRRDLLRGTLAVAALASTRCAPRTASTIPRKNARIRAVALDAFAVFDPRSVTKLAQDLVGDRAVALVEAWRRRQFEYTWLRVCAGRYQDFWRVTEDALAFASRAAKIDLDAAARARLLEAHLALDAWPDVKPALDALKANGIGVALVSNFTEEMLRSCAEHCALASSIDHFLSTDARRTYKPSPEAYALSVDAFGLGRDEIAFAAFAGWDVAGAKWFGHPTYWVNRAGAEAEEIEARADASGDFAGLVDFVRR